MRLDMKWSIEYCHQSLTCNNIYRRENETLYDGTRDKWVTRLGQAVDFSHIDHVRLGLPELILNGQKCTQDYSAFRLEPISSLLWYDTSISYDPIQIWLSMIYGYPRIILTLITWHPNTGTSTNFMAPYPVMRCRSCDDNFWNLISYY